MTSLKSINRRVGSLFAVAALVLATITPGLVPAFASAAQVTNRSVELSSSSADAPSVDYTVKFTAVGGGAVATVLQFCNDTPLIGAACSLPASFSAASATATGFTVEQTDETVANAIVVTGAVSGAVTILLEGIHNPANAGPLYVRIVTFSDADSAAAYTATVPGNNIVDQGSAAASITDTVGVSGAVLETMTFCIAKNEITKAGCTRTDLAALQAPSIEIGEPTGTVRALTAEAVSEGNIYSQLSTNAASGAVVKLKSGNDCGGLKRLTATDCDIVAATGAGGIALGEAKFGVKVSAGSDPAGSNGTFQIAGAGSPYYSTSVFKLHYNSDKSVGVTSPFGDSILDTADGPVNSKNAQITFGASISNNTPAGTYSNDFSLIATGKY